MAQIAAGGRIRDFTTVGSSVVVWAIAGAFAGFAFVLAAILGSPLLALGALVGAGVCIAIFLRPDLGLYLTALTIPLEKYGRFTQAGAVNVVSVAKIFGLVTLLAWAIYALVRRKKPYFGRELFAMLLFWLVGAFTLFYTTDLDNGLARVWSFFATLLFFFVVFNLVQDPSTLRRVLLCLALSTLGISVFALAQRYLPQYAIYVTEDVPLDAAGVVYDPSELETVGTLVARSGGASGSPHVYAANLLVALPIYFALIRLYPRQSVQLVMLAGAGLAVVNLFLTQTRAAVLVLGMALVYLLFKRVVTLNAKTVLLGVTAAILALPLLPDTVFRRLLTVEAYTRAGSATLDTRLEFWKSGLEMLKQNWLFGMGLGNFSELPKYNEIATPGFGLMHNIYLQMFNEVGIFGFAALLAFLWLVWRAFTIAERAFAARGLQDEAVVATALKVSFASVLVLGFTIDFLHFAVKDWWLVAGLAVALRRMATRPTMSPGKGT